MKEEIQKFFKGEVFDDEDTLKRYSKDASLFVVKPKLVVYPKDSEDIKKLVKYLGGKQGESLTIRAGGSDMSGGPLNDSVVVDVTKHMNKMGEVSKGLATVVSEPGVFYRDFEKKTLEQNLILPCYTASKDLNTIGGMVGNNSAGEKTLRWGQMKNFVLETKTILSDGNEYVVKPLSSEELRGKIGQDDFEGGLYKGLYKILEENKTLIESARPKVSKNSAGYYLWDVWDGETFDLNKLLVGSQGTLGVMTSAKIRLVPVEPVSRLFVIFLKDLSPLADLVNEILPTKPESIESYDDASMKLAVRFLPRHILQFIPEALMILRGGLPKLVLLVEYTGKTDEEVQGKLTDLEEKIKHFKLQTHKVKSEKEANKYWTIRRESFNLLRKHIRGARTAPFVDDVVIQPKDMPEFLPKMRDILDAHKLTYTIAGHAGNGNFHIIPLMNMKKEGNVEIIKEVSDKVYDLVAQFNGSITAEHNDGIIRTPYLGKMFSPEMLNLFQKVKDLFDPKNILNPGKKVPAVGGASGGSLEYMISHIALE